MHRFINIMLFVFIVGAMFGIQAIDDHSAEHEVARQELDKQRKAERFERAAKEVCGINAAWEDLGNGTIQCLTHKGRKTKVAAL